MNLNQQYDAISDKKSFSEFLRALAIDLETNKTEWENESLGSFLDAMSAWVADSDGYYRNQNRTAPVLDWKAVADIFMAARIYE